MITVEEWLNNNQLSLDIWHKKYQVNNENFEQWLERISGGDEYIKTLIINKKFLFGGRTLANRGIKNGGSLSNCYSIGYVPDSLSGIMDVATKIAETFKAQGGQGLSLSKIRPKGTLIKDRYTSDGIVPFMHIFNTVTESISQGGSRKGALLMSIDAWHKEADTFITIKQNPNEINKANLSVEIDDNFMNALGYGLVVVNKTYNGHSVNYTVDPDYIYNLICESALKSAEPGIIFTNRFRNYNLMEYVDEYQVETCNPCGEQPLCKHGACNLSSIDISKYIVDPYTINARVDLTSLGDDIKHIVKAMDDVLEENISRHALEEQREAARRFRNVGIGIMGLADYFVKLGITYGSEESLYILDNLMKFIFRNAVFASVDLAQERGSFPGYSPKVWDSHIIKNAFTEEEITKLRKINKLRNCSLLSIAPTGSIGTLLQISTGCEPFFALSYNRKTVSLKKEEAIYKVEVQAVKDYREITGNQGELPDYFITSREIPWKNRVKIQAVLQNYVDTAISSTVNLPKETTVEDIKELYHYAWEKKLKGITIYVEGSRDPILSAESPKDKTSQEVPKLQRGEVISAGNNWVGLKRTLVTGCGTLHCCAYFEPTNGELREIYLSKGSKGGCNNFMVSLSRMISLSARGGIGIDKILDQLKSCGVCPSYAVRTATKQDTSKGSCCPVAVGNALRDMYNEMKNRIKNCVPDIISNEAITEQIEEYEECPNCHEKSLTRQAGCIQCLSCGYSKCD